MMGEVVRLRHSHGEEEDAAGELEVEGTLLYGKRIGDIPGWGKERGHYRAVTGDGTVLCWKKGREIIGWERGDGISPENGEET